MGEGCVGGMSYLQAVGCVDMDGLCARSLGSSLGATR